MVEETLKVTGNVEVLVLDEFGNVKSKEITNMVVATGKNFIINRMAISPPSVMSHMALGESDQPTTSDMTTLVSEGLVSGSKVRSALTTTPLNNTITYSATFPANMFPSVFYAKEAGLFNSATNGVMLARTMFGVVEKQVTDVIIINWTIRID